MEPIIEKRKLTGRKFPVRWLYQQLGGQTMSMALLVLTAGTVLALAEKLSGEYITLLGIVQALVTARGVFEDKYVKQPQIRNGNPPAV